MVVMVRIMCRQWQKEMGYNHKLMQPHFLGWIPTCDGCQLCASKLATMFHWPYGRYINTLRKGR